MLHDTAYQTLILDVLAVPFVLPAWGGILHDLGASDALYWRPNSRTDLNSTSYWHRTKVKCAIRETLVPVSFEVIPGYMITLIAPNFICANTVRTFWSNSLTCSTPRPSA